jgi:putative membrane protein
MSEKIEEKKTARLLNRRVHMANERTFLSWIRTSIGIMAFGFVVEKFALFIKQMQMILGTAAVGPAAPVSHGYSGVVGILLVGFGTLMSLLAFDRFKRVERQIDEDAYRPSLTLDLVLTVMVVMIGISLAVYLVMSL